MAYDSLKTAIRNAIYDNGNEEITGSVLRTVLLGIVDVVGAGFKFAGTATPSTSPGTPQYPCFWIGARGTYANFGSPTIDVTGGELGIFMWDGTEFSKNVLKVGGDGAFDISDYTGNSYASLSAALSDIPQSEQKGGMTIKYIQSSDNKYVQYRLTADDWSTTVADWQKQGAEVSVSQNTETGKKLASITIGSVDTDIFDGGDSVYDEQWEIGDINERGVPVAGSTTLRTVNYIFCLPNQKYEIATTFSATTIGYLYEYNKNKGFIGLSAISSAKNFTTGANTSFFKIVLSSAYGTTYNNDVDIVFTDLGKEVLKIVNDLQTITSLTSTGDKIASLNINGNQIDIHNMGTNIYDEEWEAGDIEYNTGVEVPSANVLRTKNPIACDGNTEYQFVCGSPINPVGYIYQYDKYKNYKGAKAITDNSVSTDSDVAYFKIVLSAAYGTTYNNDVKVFQMGGMGSNIVKLQKGIKQIHSFSAVWEIGDIEYNTGVPVSGSTTLRTKDFIKCKDFDSFNIITSYSRTPLGYIYYYDDNKSFIRNSVVAINKGITVKNKSAKFFKIVLSASYGTTYNNNILFQALFNSENITYTVAKDGSGDFTTVTEAVANCSDGDIVFIKNGVYDNEAIKAWYKNISIIGEDRNKVVIMGAGDYLNPPLEMSSGLLKNVSIYAYGETPSPNGRYAYAIHADANILTNNSFTVENCSLRTKMGYGAVGMGLRGGCNVLFRDCDFISDNYIAFFMNETVTSLGQSAGDQKFEFNNCKFICNGGGSTISGLTSMVLFEGYKSSNGLVYATFINNVFVHKDWASPKARFIHCPEQYWDGGDIEGNIVINSEGDKMINWFITEQSFGNNIAAMNRCHEGNINGLQ